MAAFRRAATQRPPLWLLCADENKHWGGNREKVRERKRKKTRQCRPRARASVTMQALQLRCLRVAVGVLSLFYRDSAVYPLIKFACAF